MNDDYEEYEVYEEFEEKPFAKCRTKAHPTEEKLLQSCF